MLNLILEMSKKKIIYLSIITSLFLWAVFASYFALTKSEHYLIVDQNFDEPRIFSKTLDRVEVKDRLIDALMLKFTVYCMSFNDREVFIKNMMSCQEVVEPSVFNRFRKEIRATFDEVKAKNLKQGIDLIKISSLKKEGYFEIEFRVFGSVGNKTFNQRRKLQVKIVKSKPTLNNALGYKIGGINEAFL